jgi:uroporphyrinogen decarboxylase
MSRRERVAAALAHRPVDRVPRGEIGLQAGFVAAFLGDAGRGLAERERELAVRRGLHMDLVNVHEYPRAPAGRDGQRYPLYRGALGEVFVERPQSFGLVRPALARIEDAAAYRPADPASAPTERLEWFRDHSDLYLVAQVMGPVSALDWALGTEDYLCWSLEYPEAIALVAGRMAEYETARARRFLAAGADAILVTDDIAFTGGQFLPPAVMAWLAYPLYRRLVEAIKAVRDVPVVFHSDGDLNACLPELAACGFDGLQSLQPSAGMDIAAVRRQYGDRLALWGNVDLDYLLPFGRPEEVRAEVGRLLADAGRDGGFILSTCNILTDAVPVANAVAMYETGLG